MDFGVSRRFMIIAISVLVFIFVVRLTPKEHIVNSLHETKKCFLDPTAAKDADSKNDAAAGFQITDKVALITDTQYSARLIPLILHYHAVLGPEWPIVFFTSNDTLEKHLDTEAKNGSAIWRRLVERGQIQLRTIPTEYNMRDRDHVNLYLTRPWLWEQLAPAKHVLVFQTDAMLCGNSHRTMDDFLQWDFIGAPLHTSWHVYNGGLSLRNRTMMMEILQEASWEEEVKSGAWDKGGEDVWFSDKMGKRGGRTPDFKQALQFACQHDWHISEEKEPLGYHKVHKAAHGKLDEIAEWCPEIALAAPGTLPQTHSGEHP